MKINISGLRDLTGLIGACLVDSDSGMILTTEYRGGIDLELAGAGITQVVRAMRTSLEMLKSNDKLEDILMSLEKQYHLIRLLESNEAIFIYVVLDRKIANLALARIMMKKVDQALDLR